MTMSYLKKLSVEDALTMLAEKLNDALKPVERGDNLSLDAQLELDGLATLCRTYALDAAQGELTAAGEPGSICDTAAGLFILAESVKEHLDERMVDAYSDAIALMNNVMDDWAAEAALNELDDAVRAAGLLGDGEDLYCMAIGENDEIPELEDDQRVIPVSMDDETLVECLEDAEDALVEAGQMDTDEILLLIAGPAQEAGENIIHLLTWEDDEEFGDDQEIVLLAGTGFDDEGEDEDGPGIELVDMADLEDGEAEAVKNMADLLVAAGMMHPDQDICIAKVGVPADGRPYASLYIGDDTILTVTPG